MSNLLELNGVCKDFSEFSLNNISFSLPKGYIMGLVGPNGAGKTTTIQLILNMLERDSGEIFIFGKDNIKEERYVKQHTGIVFDTNIYTDAWTVRDTEKAVSIFYDEWEHNIFKDMIDRFNLPWNKKIKEFSRGMQMKLMLASAFSHNAKLLILDEPTSGLDPLTRSELLEILQDYISDGERSVLFSTHITADLERVADYITFLESGHLFFTGSIDDFRGNYVMIKGKPSDLTPELEKEVFGLRNTSVGFEGIIEAKNAIKYSGCVTETATIDDIVVGVSKQEAKI